MFVEQNETNRLSEAVMNKKTEGICLHILLSTDTTNQEAVGNEVWTPLTWQCEQKSRSNQHVSQRGVA